MADYIVGIDAGGTKTTATAYAMDGTELLSAVGEFGNLTVDFESGITHIIQTVDTLLAKSEGTLRFLCLGCAGIETGDNKLRATKRLQQKYGDIVYCTNDALLALYAALKGKDGALIIAGTGSIGYLKKGSALFRCGGWGHLINDDGSGYSIGIKAIRTVTDGFDNGNGETPLKKAIFEKLGLKELRELIAFVYAADKAEIAALVPVVEALAEQGDESCRAILLWAGECLAKTATTLFNQHKLEEKRIALSGSVIRKTKIINRQFRACTQKLAPKISEESFVPQKGAYYIYKERENNENHCA